LYDIVTRSHTESYKITQTAGAIVTFKKQIRAPSGTLYYFWF